MNTTKSQRRFRKAGVWALVGCAYPICSFFPSSSPFSSSSPWCSHSSSHCPGTTAILGPCKSPSWEGLCSRAAEAVTPISVGNSWSSSPQAEAKYAVCHLCVCCLNLFVTSVRGIIHFLGEKKCRQDHTSCLKKGDITGNSLERFYFCKRTRLVPATNVYIYIYCFPDPEHIYHES